MTQFALVLGSEEFGNEPLHTIWYGVSSRGAGKVRRSSAKTQRAHISIHLAHEAPCLCWTETWGFVGKEGVGQELHYGAPEHAKSIWPGLAKQIDAAVAQARLQ